MNEKKERSSNIEILRIIAMVLITIGHYFVHGIDNGSILVFNGTSFKPIFMQFAILGRLGNAIFILISGYFLVSSKFKLKKLLKIIFQTMFFSVTIYLVTSIYYKTITPKGVILSFFPILNNVYWFISCYVVLYILSGALNKLLNNLNKKQSLLLCLVLFLLISLIPRSFSYYLTDFSFRNFFGEMAIFIMLYCIGGVIRKYFADLNHSKNWKNLLFALLFLLLMYLEILLYNYANFKNAEKFSGDVYNILYHSNIFVILTAAFLLIFFANLKMKNIRFINYISSSTFAVYLFHDNGAFMGCFGKGC